MVRTQPSALVTRKMNVRVVIERDVTVRAASGGKKAWTTAEPLCEVFAEMGYYRDRGREDFGTPDWPTSKQTATFSIWQRMDVKTDMRVRWTHQGVTRYFSIRTIKAASWVDKRMTLECEEVI